MAFPAVLSVERTVSPQALVSFGGNFYSVPPGLAASIVTVTHRLGTATLDIATAGGLVLARHERAPDGAGAFIRDDVHVRALERAVLAAFSTSKPCKRKARRPPSPAALAEAQVLTMRQDGHRDLGRNVVVDLAVWADAARTRQVAP